MLKDVEVARDFFAIHLPEKLKATCDLSTLRISETSYVEDYQEHLSDILYQVNMEEGSGYLYVLIEHISEATGLIPFQVLKYQVSILQQHLSQQLKSQRKQEKLPIVIPVLFYRGKKSPYPHSTDVMDCFCNPDLAREVFLRPLTLVDLSTIPDDVLKTHRSVALLELIQKHIHTRDLVYKLQGWTKHDRLHRQTSLHAFEMMIKYMWSAGRYVEAPEFIRIIEHTDIEREYIETMQTAAQQLRAEGMEAGMEAGMQQGMEAGMEAGMQQGMEAGIYQEKYAIARNMIAAGWDTPTIHTMTGLSEKEINQLKEE
jgi:predicted transposase/invertase (TIGR01784 family)